MNNTNDYISNINSKYRNIVQKAIKRDFFINHDLMVTASNLVYGKRPYKSPVLTIVVPTFNRYELLKRCLNSIKLQKTDINFEVIVIDNNPEHLTKSPVLEIIKQLQDDRFLYYVNSTNVGGIGNWNSGFNLAYGEWIALVHDDDILNANWTAVMNRTLEGLNNVDVLCCKLKYLRNSNDCESCVREQYEDSAVQRWERNNVKKGITAPVLGAWVRKDFFVSLGGFGTETPFIEDYIFMGNAVIRGNIYVLDSALYGYWVSSTNDSASPGLWDAVIVCEYFYRRQLMNKLGYGRSFSSIYSIFKVERAIISHNIQWMGLQDFEGSIVDSKTIVALCEIKITKHIIMYTLAYLYSFFCCLRSKR